MILDQLKCLSLLVCFKVAILVCGRVSKIKFNLSNRVEQTPLVLF